MWCILTLLLFFGCRQDRIEVSDSSRMYPQNQQNQQRKEVQAIFTSPKGERSVFMLEVADDPETRSRGLMYRRNLDPDKGMLFVFPREDIQVFWMKNTYIPLDMIFINQNLEVVGVIEDAKPMTLDSRSVSKPSQFVVEISAYGARKHGIIPGSKVRFEPPINP